MITHELKCWPEHFAAVELGSKSFEIRLNDRNYAVGDMLLLREWCPQARQFTGSALRVMVHYLLDDPAFLAPGYVCLSIRVAPHG